MKLPRRNFLHLAAGAAALPTLKWRALAPSTSVAAAEAASEHSVPHVATRGAIG